MKTIFKLLPSKRALLRTNVVAMWTWAALLTVSAPALLTQNSPVPLPALSVCASIWFVAIFPWLGAQISSQLRDASGLHTHREGVVEVLDTIVT